MYVVNVNRFSGVKLSIDGFLLSCFTTSMIYQTIKTQFPSVESHCVGLLYFFWL